MVGVITGWDILAHPISTIRCFGWQVFFKAVAPWQGRTFLSVVRDAGFLTPSGSSVPMILERCIALELRAKRIYRALAKALDDQGLAGPFFAGLVEQEQHHVDLLEVCRAVAIRGGWKANLFNPWEEYLPRLEQQMADTESAMSTIDSVDAALRLVVQVESSEINQVFCAALVATGLGLREKAQTVSEGDGGPHVLPRAAASTTVSQIDAGDKRTAAQVSWVRSEPR